MTHPLICPECSNERVPQKWTTLSGMCDDCYQAYTEKMQLREAEEEAEYYAALEADY